MRSVLSRQCADCRSDQIRLFKFEIDGLVELACLLEQDDLTRHGHNYTCTKEVNIAWRDELLRARLIFNKM